MLVRCWLAAVAAVAVWLLRGVWCTEATVAVIRSVPSRCVSTLGRCDTARAVVSVVSVFGMWFFLAVGSLWSFWSLGCLSARRHHESSSLR